MNENTNRTVINLDKGLITLVKVKGDFNKTKLNIKDQSQKDDFISRFGSYEYPDPEILPISLNV